jgi:adenine deaminase
VANFSAPRLARPLKTDRAWVIDVAPGTIVTTKSAAPVARDAAGNFDFAATNAAPRGAGNSVVPPDPIAKIAVVERHHGTGNVAVALVRGYGIQRGALALSVAHDSHNIIALGTTDADMALAVETLIAQGGGFAVTLAGTVLETLPLPIAGLMSDQSGDWVTEKLDAIHAACHEKLRIHPEIEPLMSLSFMSLPVIPELKLTDHGLFDVTKFAFTDINAE